MNKLSFLFLSSSLLFLSACSDEALVFRDYAIHPRTNEKVVEASIDFSTISAQILVPYCVKCHGRFANYENVLGRLDEIQDSIVNNRMPKGMPALTNEEKSLLDAWVKAGAPQALANPEVPAQQAPAQP